MGISSMICGIVGILGAVITSTRLMYLNNQNTLIQFMFQRELYYLRVFIILFLLLIILAIIFGIISLKKGKEYKYRGMGKAGFVLGITGFAPFVAIVIISLVTFNTLNTEIIPQTTIVDPSSPYLGSRPSYEYFTDIGQITTRSNDTSANYSVTIEVNIGYDRNDTEIRSELSLRRDEIHDFINYFISTKNVSELEDEEMLKREILELLNTQYLENNRIRIILFDRLDITENF